jgi:hypothetical protein
METDRELEDRNALVFSYLTLRKAIGILGIALPFVVALGAAIIFQQGLQGSISGYYYTGMRNVFVGSLWATAFFLLCYKGYGRLDDLAGDFGCLAAIGITLFPTTPDPASAVDEFIGRLHFVFGAAFFLTLIFFSVYLFRKKAKDKTPTPEKLLRNNVYLACGIVMVVCMVLIGIFQLLRDGPLASLVNLNPTFWLETFALLAFGLSWFTKGEGIFKDKEPTSSQGPEPQPLPGGAQTAA